MEQPNHYRVRFPCGPLMLKKEYEDLIAKANEIHRKTITSQNYIVPQENSKLPKHIQDFLNEVNERLNK